MIAYSLPDLLCNITLFDCNATYSFETSDAGKNLSSYDKFLTYYL